MLPNKNARNPKKFTVHNIKNALIAIWRYWTNGKIRRQLKDWLAKPEPVPEDPKFDTLEEVVQWRSQRVLEKSPECIRDGYCHECGCPSSELLFQDDPCKAGCFPSLSDSLRSGSGSWSTTDSNNQARVYVCSELCVDPWG